MEQALGDFTPDGHTILFAQHSNLDKRGDLLLVDVDGETSHRTFLAGPSDETSPRLSPDGRWVAYLSDASGQRAIWVTDFPAAKGRWQVGSHLRGLFGWLSGDELYWEDADNHLVAATIRADGDELEIRAKRLLINGRSLSESEFVFDYSTATQQFLLGKVVDDVPQPRLVVVSDWRALLRDNGEAANP